MISRAATRSSLLALAAAAVTLVPASQAATHAGTGPATTAPPIVTTVKITVTDTAIRMSPKVAQRGSIARFILVNVGKKRHTFALGHEKRGTATQTGFTKTLKPNQQSVLILFLDYRGILPYRATLKADRANPKMRGTFKII